MRAWIGFAWLGLLGLAYLLVWLLQLSLLFAIILRFGMEMDGLSRSRFIHGMDGICFVCLLFAWMIQVTFAVLLFLPYILW